jgi:hypothetical protein
MEMGHLHPMENVVDKVQSFLGKIQAWVVFPNIEMKKR